MSVKWTAALVGAGMGIIYVIHFIYNTVNQKKKIGKFSFNWRLILWSIFSFIIVPIVIYILSYIPIIMNSNEGITDIQSFIAYQKRMYKYHSELEATHPYSSQWYTWPIMKVPLWFYVSYQGDYYATIACMGNPAIWWLSIATAIFTLIYLIIKKDKAGLIIIIMICTTWLLYAFIGRIMFIYHYFITLPFMMLTIAFTVDKLIKWKDKFKYVIPVLTLIFLGFFIYFYPVYSGKPVEREYIEKTEWFDTWSY